MATSNNTSWELTRDSIIAAAYRKLGIPGEGNTLTTTQYTEGAEALNAVIALAVTDGMPLWKRTTSTQTPTTTTQAFTLSDAVKIAAVFLRDPTSGVQYELENKSLYDFNRLPYGTTGIPVSWIFEPANEGGVVKIYPNKADSGTVSSKQIVIVYQAEFDSFTATGESLDFPAYWTQPIIYATAVTLAPENGVPTQDRQLLLQESKMYWDKASNYGDEDGSLFIQPYQREWK